MNLRISGSLLRCPACGGVRFPYVVFYVAQPTRDTVLGSTSIPQPGDLAASLR